MTPYDFSIGGLHGWRGVLLGLSASVVFLIAGWQDVDPGIGMASSAFWFLLALVTTGGVVWLGVGTRISGGALLGVTFLCLEVRFIWRRWRQTHTV